MHVLRSLRFASKDDVLSCDMQECCVCHANRLLL